MEEVLSSRQREIVDKAIALIAEKGIQNLTIKNLAQKMGFSEPAIYRHFPGKTEILLAIIELFEEKRSQSMDQNLATSSFSESLKHLLSKHIQLFAKNPTYATVIFSEELFMNEPELLQKMQSIMNHNEGIILNLIEKNQQKGDIRKDIDKHSLALIIMGGMRLIVKRWVLSCFASELTKDVNNFRKTIVKLCKEEK
ncbi:MAG: TetR/AcrR family transcriptional regulator [Candidatus Margulisbacteria bacterium]|nr:TetR/AcrR family transcriptional regulator [Candidatus Margulisiibacteriota bacterium]